MVAYSWEWWLWLTKIKPKYAALFKSTHPQDFVIARQYVTDVFGDQSVDYIRDKADQADPFFLYTSFTAPHTPMQATASDLAFIDSLNDSGLTGNRRTYAAMQYAMDRNVGKIIAALDDPDGNPLTNDSVAENTMVIFINDNGGDCCDAGPNSSNNGDLRNGKGSQFEGGMRVPMIVAGAGVNTQVRGTVSAALVHAIDIVPTAYIGAGGGSFGASEVIDGENLLPYINGTAAGVAHDSLFISRYNNQQTAVRMGKWKYMYQNGTGYQLYDLDNDLDETNNLVNSPAHESVVEQAHQLLASYHVQLDKPRHDNQADDTNQFDHFQFREANFTSATFSTAGAWTNGETGLGTVAASWRDGYANNELTFRTKPSGDYTITNDLKSAGGFSYMANKINLIDQTASLGSAKTGTINGLPILMTKSRSGTLPVINVDATDSKLGLFTFEVDLDIHTYDDLTIEGDGNQTFRFNGAVKEFRPGRSLTKRGTAEVTIGGPVELTGTVDLQGGKVSFIDGKVGGTLVTRSGITLSVGGSGFNKLVTTPPNTAPIVSDGLDLHYNAMLDSAGDSNWDDVAGNQNSISFSGGASPTSVNDPTFLGINSAYDIASVGSAEGLNAYFEGTGNSTQRSREDATFEVWFHVDSTTAGGNQVIFEAGATRGVSLTLDNDTLNFNVDGDGSTFTLSEMVGEGWHQAVGIIDLVGNSDNQANDSVTLYVDNTLVGTLSNVLVDDWAGGNSAGIGGDSAGTTGGSPIDYHDQISIVRYYNDYLFDSQDVDANYQAALFDGGGDQLVQATTLAVGGDLLLEDGTSLELDVLDPENFDRVAVAGNAIVSGELVISALEGFEASLGDEYELLTAASLVGEFEAASLPSIATGQMWQIEYRDDAVALLVTIAGDYNGDGSVDGADYTVWRDLLNQAVPANALADGDGDGLVGMGDYEVWKSNYGMELPAQNSFLRVPEPKTSLLIMTVVYYLAGLRFAASRIN